MSHKVPEKIGRYLVQALLGQGAMGSVYLGRDPVLDRKVAIKTVRDLDLDEPRKKSFLERFKNEARAAARLSHPSIVAVYDVGEEEGIGPFLVFEYVSGSTLKQVVRSRGALPPSDVMAVVRQIADALSVAHAAGIIHRDVKPDNILVSDDGRAKLADFGVARVPDAALTKEGQFLGTPCYAAPETLAKGTYSERSDLFSFAAVVYELVCGVRAFPGDDAISVAHAVVHEHPPPPSEAGTRAWPKAIDDVIMRGLAKSPEQRFLSASEMADTLEDAFIAEGLLEPGELALSPRSRRRGNGWVYAGILAVAGALGIALVFAFRGESTIGDPIPVDEFSVLEDAGVGRAISNPMHSVDAGSLLDAGISLLDTGIDAGSIDERDAGISGMSRLEREDAAKDAIDRARTLIARGRMSEARQELDHARELDPESSDLEEIERSLER